MPDAPRLPRPDVSGRMHVDTRARILAEATARQGQVIAGTAARQQIFAGVLGAIVVAGCFVIAVGGSQATAPNPPVEKERGEG